MGVPNTSVARVVGVDSQFAIPAPAGSARLQQSVGLVAVGNDGVGYSLDPVRIFSPQQAADLYGPGSPLHSMAKVLLPPDGSGLGSVPLTAYPVDAVGGGTALGAVNVGTLGTGLFDVINVDSVVQVTCGDFVTDPIFIPKTATALAMVLLMASPLQTILDVPFIVAGDGGSVGLTFLAKWAGQCGNGQTVRAEWLEGGGTFRWSNFDTVLGNGTPDIGPALEQIRNRRETFLVSGFNPGESSILDSFDVFGEQHWQALHSAPTLAVTGIRDPSLSAATAITAGRELDRTNILAQAPGIDASHYTLAAEVVARIVGIANDDPARDYQGQSLQNVLVGPDLAVFTLQIGRAHV